MKNTITTPASQRPVFGTVGLLIIDEMQKERRLDSQLTKVNVFRALGKADPKEALTQLYSKGAVSVEVLQDICGQVAKTGDNPIGKRANELLSNNPDFFDNLRHI